MTYHYWGDGFNFKKLHRAEIFICKYVEDNSPCYVITKEKYGTIRYESVFPKGKGYFYKRNKIGDIIVQWLLRDKNGVSYWKGVNKRPWYKKFIDTFIYPTPYYELINYLDYKKTVKGNKVLKEAIEKAMFKYPDIMAEIVDDSPFDEHKRLQYNIKPQYRYDIREEV